MCETVDSMSPRELMCLYVCVDIRCVCGCVTSSSLPTTISSSGQNVPGLIRVGIDVSQISLSVSRRYRQVLDDCRVTGSGDTMVGEMKE